MKKCSHNECGGAAYFLGVIGAAVYNLSVTTGFWASVVALLKSLVWPAYLVYELFTYIGA